MREPQSAARYADSSAGDGNCCVERARFEPRVDSPCHRPRPGGAGAGAKPRCALRADARSEWEEAESGAAAACATGPVSCVPGLSPQCGTRSFVSNIPPFPVRERPAACSPHCQYGTPARAFKPLPRVRHSPGCVIPRATLGRKRHRPSCHRRVLDNPACIVEHRPPGTDRRPSMTRAELCARVAVATSLSKSNTATAADAVFAEVADARRGKTVNVAGFGKFTARDRPARTGEAVAVAPSRVPAFRPTKLRQDAVNARQGPRPVHTAPLTASMPPVTGRRASGCHHSLAVHTRAYGGRSRTRRSRPCSRRGAICRRSWR